MQVFNENTHIVAVKTSGNVYCMQALEELCIKPKSYRDLISDEPFTRKDIITIQDSQKVDGLNYDRLLKVGGYGGGGGDEEENEEEEGEQ